MKLTLILLIAFVLHAGARGTAQTVTLSVKDMPLEKVCKEVERQTGYFFVYAGVLNKNAYQISVNIEHAEIKEALTRIFQGLPYSYQVIDKVVVVNTATKLISQHQPANGDPIPEIISKVQGRVINESGTPLSGATVTNKASSKVVLTDNKGEFVLTNIVSNTNIVITYVGYKPQTILVKGATYLEVQMEAATSTLDETVVKGYYSTSNQLNTGDVSTVKGEDIAKQPVTDPLLALEARVPGLYIQQTSGVPGAYSTIRLRGQNSFYNAESKLSTANDPLFIVDGVPFSSQSLSSPFYLGNGAVGQPDNLNPGLGLSPFNNLNPQDIESVQVLKDADATAIYGSRGANGVILITTKKGKAGKTKVDANAYTGGSKVTRRMNLLNTQQYLSMRREAFINDGLPLPSITNNPYDGNYDINGVWDTARYTDWQKLLIGKSSRFSNAQLNISGGNSNTQFIIGGGYTLNGVVLPGDYKDRKISVHLNLNHLSENRRFTTSLSANFMNDKSNLPQSDVTSLINLPPDAPAVFDANGSLNWKIYNGYTTFFNPLASTFQTFMSITNTLTGNFNFSYRLLPGLDLKSNFGYTHSDLDEKALTPSISIPPPDNTDPSYRRNLFGNNDIQTWIIEPQITYQRALAKGILDVLVGATFQDNELHHIAYGSRGFANDALIRNPAAAASFYLAGNQYTQYRYNSLYGRIGYRWEDKYLLNITARRDGSSRFGPGKQFGNFGAIGAAWIFSKEEFIHDMMPFLSFGKLRISYGSTGSDNLQDYYYLSTYTPISNTYQSITALNPDRLTNPYFAWEVVKKWEGGLELGFVNDRIILSASYYRNRTQNQLIGRPLPDITGYNTVQFNLPALIQNTGIEIILSTINFRTKAFSWSTTANLSIPRNKLVAFPDISKYPAYAQSYTIGQSIFSRKIVHYIGVDPQTGYYTMALKKGSGYPSFPDDYVATKPVTQQYYGGVQNTISYGRIQLDILFQFVKQLGSAATGGFSWPGSNINQPTSVLDRWRRPGDRTSIQRFSQSFFPGALDFVIFNGSDGVITDASFIRLKNLALSYQFPIRWLKPAALQNGRLYIQCQNLLTITKYRGMDPETGGALSLPPLRTISGGLQITF